MPPLSDIAVIIAAGVVGVWAIVFAAELLFLWRSKSIWDEFEFDDLDEIADLEPSTPKPQNRLSHASRWFVAAILLLFLAPVLLIGTFLLMPPTVAVRWVDRLARR